MAPDFVTAPARPLVSCRLFSLKGTLPSQASWVSGCAEAAWLWPLRVRAWRWLCRPSLAWPWVLLWPACTGGVIYWWKHLFGPWIWQAQLSWASALPVAPWYCALYSYPLRWDLLPFSFPLLSPKPPLPFAAASACSLGWSYQWTSRWSWGSRAPPRNELKGWGCPIWIASWSQIDWFLLSIHLISCSWRCRFECTSRMRRCTSWTSWDPHQVEILGYSGHSWSPQAVMPLPFTPICSALGLPSCSSNSAIPVPAAPFRQRLASGELREASWSADSSAGAPWPAETIKPMAIVYLILLAGWPCSIWWGCSAASSHDVQPLTELQVTLMPHIHSLRSWSIEPKPCRSISQWQMCSHSSEVQSGCRYILASWLNYWHRLIWASKDDRLRFTSQRSPKSLPGFVRRGSFSRWWREPPRSLRGFVQLLAFPAIGKAFA